jgi:hypothetical protein
MKKFFLLLVIFFGVFSNLIAQRVNEGFGSSTFPPTGWSLVDPSAIVNRDAVTNAYGNTSNVGSVYGDYYNVSSGTATLETDSFSSTASGDSLRFDVGYAAYPGYVDTFAVLAYVGSSYVTLRQWISSSTADTGMTTASATTGQFTPSSSQWRTKVIALPLGTTKVQFKFMTGYGNELYIDNVIVDSFFLATQTLDSVTTIQSFTNLITQGGADQRIMQIPVKVTGQLSPMSVTSFSLNTSGTTTPSSTLDSAKIYFTGSSSTFATTGKFGSVASPNGAFTISGSQVLANGFNYFWLVYNIKSTAAVGNSVDALCSSVTIGGVSRTPNVTSPAGSYQIAKVYTFDTATNQNFTTALLSGNVPCEWQRGTPVNVGPATAFTAPSCWGTNISGNYTAPASPLTESYVLISPSFIATTTSLIVSYREWYSIYSADNGTFQYKINSGSWTNLGASVTGTVAAWNEKLNTVTPSVNDTVQFRWNFSSVSYSIPSAGWYIDNFAIANATEIDLVPPTIAYAVLSNTSSLTNRTLSNFATITDNSGIDTTTANKPRIYYKKKSENNAFGTNTSAYNGWKYKVVTTNSSPFSFTIDYSLLYSSVAAGDTIQYFIVAQDQATAHNLAANPSAGFSGSSITSITSAPSAPNSYIIISASPLSGSYNVGSGQTYTTLTAAVNDLNLRGVSGSVVFNLTDVTYSSAETFPISIGNVGGASSTNTVTIKPTLTGTVITGSASSLITLNGSKYVTLNGAVSGTSRDLTISNTSTAAVSAVVFASGGAGLGCANDTIRNCILKCAGNYSGSVALNIGGAAFTGSSTFAVTPDATKSADNTAIGVVNNQLCKALIGLGLTGTSTNKASYIFISGNLLGSTTTSADYLCWGGAFLANASNITFSQNTIKNIITSTSVFDAKAILGYNGLSNSTVAANTIDSVVFPGTGGWGANGIDMEGAYGIAIYNNMITRLYGDGWYPAGSSDAITGIRIWSGSNYTVYYNTVNITGTYAGYSGATKTAGFYAGSAASGINLRNNIFSNSFANSNGTTGTNSYAFASDATGSGFININYNNYIASGTQGVTGFAASTNQATLSALVSAIGGNVNSKTVTVTFTSTGDGHLSGASIGDVNLGCAPVGGITTDIDGQTRYATWHYMGADEVTTSPLPVILTSFSAVKSNADVLLKWITASEINSDYFVVERSLNGTDFTPAGKISAAGNSAKAIAYQYLDANVEALANNGTAYYRLVQFDRDGKSATSGTVSVDFSARKIGGLTSYPNPFSTDVNLSVDANEAGKLQMQVADLQGKVVFTKYTDVIKGNNTIGISEMSTLTNGIYIITTSLNGENRVFKLVKNRN